MRKKRMTKIMAVLLSVLLVLSVSDGWWSLAYDNHYELNHTIPVVLRGTNKVIGTVTAEYIGVSWQKSSRPGVMYDYVDRGKVPWPSGIPASAVSFASLSYSIGPSVSSGVSVNSSEFGKDIVWEWTSSITQRLGDVDPEHQPRLIIGLKSGIDAKKVNFYAPTGVILGTTSALKNSDGKYYWSNIAAPTSPAGSVFLGWSTSSTTFVDAEESAPASAFINDTLSLYAFFDKLTTVSFDPNGASGTSPDNITYSESGTYNYPDVTDTLSYPGYTFAGWGDAQDSYSSGGTLYQPGDLMILPETSSDKTFYAQWAKNYTVDYNMNGGISAVPQPQYAVAGPDGSVDVTVNTASDFTRPGFDFEGWSTNQTASTADIAPGDTITVSDDTTLYAVWSGKQYNISFDDNGADPASNPGITDIPATYGDTVTLPSPALQKDYCIFEGWCEDNQGNGTVYPAGGSYTIGDSTPENLTLFAKWKDADQYTLSFDNGADDALGNLPTGGTYYNDGVHDQVTLPVCTLTRPGYTFAGWSKTKNGAVDYADGDTFTITENTTLHAVWTEGEFSLTYDFNGEGDALHGAMPTNIQGGPSSNITASPQGTMAREFYRFTGWNTQADGGGAAYVPGALIYLDHNMNLYAQWEALSPVRLTYNNGCDDPLVAVPSDTKEYYDDGVNDKGQVSTGLPDRFGYNFKGWNTKRDGTGTTYQPGGEIVVTGNTELFAIWEEGTYTLTYSRNAAGATGALPDDVTGKLNSTVRAGSGANLSYAHHHFKEWNTKADGAGTGYQAGDKVSLGQDITLYAIWEKNVYEVDYSLNADNAQGTVPDTDTGSYDETFTAPDQTGITRPKYRPVGWNDDPEGKGTDYTPGTQYSFEGDKTLYVKWEAVPPYEVHYFKNADDATGDPPADDNTYCEDGVTPASVTVLDDNGMKRRGYEFAGWNTKPDGTGLTYQPGDNFIIKTHMNFYAQWEMGTYTLSFDKGHSGVTGSGPAAIKSRSDKYITLPKEGGFKRKDFGFTGWNTKADGTGTFYKAGDKVKILEDTTHYAQWKRLVSVSFDNSEGALKGDTSLQVTEGTKLGDVKLPSVNSGYTVKEWIINGEKVTDYKNYVVDKDSDVVLVLEKKKDPTPAPKPDDGNRPDNNKPDNTKPDNNKPDGSKPDNSKPNGGSNGGSGGNNGGNGGKDQDKGSGGSSGGNHSGGESGNEGGSNGFSNGTPNSSYGRSTYGGNTAASGKLTSEKGSGIGTADDNYHTSPVYPDEDTDTPGTADSSLTSLADEQVPLSDGGGMAGISHKAYGSPRDCLIHWLVLLGILISAIYFVLRCRYIKMKEILQNSFVWDTLIPMLAIPAAAFAYLYMECSVDLPLIILWLFAVLLGMYLDKRSFQNNIEKVEAELLLLEKEVSTGERI